MQSVATSGAYLGSDERSDARDRRGASRLRPGSLVGVLDGTLGPGPSPRPWRRRYDIGLGTQRPAQSAGALTGRLQLIQFRNP
jgi:hypothetical protein